MKHFIETAERHCAALAKEAVAKKIKAVSKAAENYAKSVVDVLFPES
jgi:hypothetical protein